MRVITRDQLQERIAAIQSSIRSLESQLDSAMGNLQDCQYWLAVLTDSVPEEKDDGRDPDRHE
jgi:hypothetical protein